MSDRVQLQPGPVYALDGNVPVIAAGVFVAPTAAVIGNVAIGAGASVWFSAVIRGDDMPVSIGEGTNVQDGAVVHSTEDVCAATIGRDVVVGHGAILHGCVVGDGAMIGIGAVVLDGAIVGSGAVVAAGALVPPGKEVPPGQLWVGSPGAVRRPVGPSERDFLAYAPDHYRKRGALYLANGVGARR